MKREIAMRRHVYPRRVGDGRMTQKKADDELRAMEAVLETVEAAAQAGRLLWTRADRLRALLPALYDLYWKAKTTASEHRALVLAHAIDGIPPWCEPCGHLLVSAWLAAKRF